MNYIKTTLLAAIIGLMPIVPANAQSDKVLKEKNPEFFKTEEARRIGDQLLIWQRNTGGWPTTCYSATVTLVFPGVVLSDYSTETEYTGLFNKKDGSIEMDSTKTADGHSSGQPSATIRCR